jgi:1-acyl-sn-glycerol-3-phosphate acyltransferase
MLYTFCRNLVWVFFRSFLRVEIKGLENIPKEEGFLLCPNHYSSFDPLFVATCFPRKVRFMAKQEIFKNSILGNLLLKIGVFPVKRGEADLHAIKTAIKVLKDNEVLGLFPEGKRIKGSELGKANSGVAMFSIKSGKSVLPVCIIGTYKPFSKMKVIYGQPIDFTEYKKTKMTNDDYLELSQIVMKKIGELKKEEV